MVLIVYDVWLIVNNLLLTTRTLRSTVRPSLLTSSAPDRHHQERSMNPTQGKRPWAQMLCAVALAAVATFSHAQQRTQLLIYTALETDAMKLYKDGFEKANPDIEVKWVRDSTGIVTAKLLAEKANPQADVIAGLAASSLALLELRRQASAGLGRHGRVGRHHLLQSCRGSEARPAKA